MALLLAELPHLHVVIMLETISYLEGWRPRCAASVHQFAGMDGSVRVTFRKYKAMSNSPRAPAIERA